MRELEEKFKNQEIQLKNQFDGIVKLNEKIKVLKEKKGIKVEDSKQTPKDQPISEEVKEKIEKLEKSIEVLQHSKISEAKAMLFTKIMNERKIKELQEKVAALENEIKEKNKENQLSSIKIKDIIRAKLSINPKKVLLPELNNSIVNDMNNKVSFPSSGTQNNDSDSNRRSKSIEPLNSRESTKSKVDSNLASRLNRVKAPSKDFNTLINTTETNFESELEKASNAKLATVNDAVPKSRPGLPDLTQGKSALLNHAKQSISKRLNKGTKEEKDLTANPAPEKEEVVFSQETTSKNEAALTPDVIISHNQPEEQIKVAVEAIDDKFENLGGDNSLNFAL